METMSAAEKHDRISFRMFWETMAMVLLAMVLGLLVNQIHTGRLSLVGDWSSEARVTPDSGKDTTISLEEATLRPSRLAGRFEGLIKTDEIPNT